jgi:hypothetical protein
MSESAGPIRETLKRLRAENRRLRIELIIAQGTNRALEDWIKGYRVCGRKPLWVSLYREQCGQSIGAARSVAHTKSAGLVDADVYQAECLAHRLALNRAEAAEARAVALYDALFRFVSSFKGKEACMTDDAQERAYADAALLLDDMATASQETTHQPPKPQST